jgi:ribosome-associated protein
MKKTKKVDSEDLCNAIVFGMQEKKGTDIVSLDLRKIPNAISDFFIICSGTSEPQIDAISQSVDEAVFKKYGENPWHKEGIQNKEWILLDYVNVVVHIFKKDRREFYDIESLWGDAQSKKHDTILEKA